jgi:hypothetical protein
MRGNGGVQDRCLHQDADPIGKETRRSEGPMGEALVAISTPAAFNSMLDSGLQIPLYPLLQHRCLCNERSYRDLITNKDETSSAK